MGRRPLCIDLVERMQGDPRAKERLMAVLESLQGDGSVKELASICGVKRSRFYELRDQALWGALCALYPDRRGPKPREIDERDELIASLEGEVDSLRVQLVAARVRTEVALVMPHLLHEPSTKVPKRRRRGRAATRNGGTTAG
jgi:transposase-like protein